MTDEQIINGAAERIQRQFEAWEKHAQEAHGYNPLGEPDMRFKYDRSMYGTHIECRTRGCKWKRDETA